MRRLLIAALGLSVAFGILFGSHYYIARRLVLDPGLPDPWRGVGLALVALAAASLVATPICERTLPPAWSRAVAWPASLWMGVGFWLLILLGFTDVLLGISGAASAASEPAVSGVRAALVVSVAGSAAVVALRSGLRPPLDRRLEIEIASWPRAFDGFRIVQISDVHIGPLLGRRFAEEITRRVNRLSPDLVAVTGDLVDGGVRQLAAEVAPFADLKAKHGVFFVTGNHDHYSGADSWVAKAGELGMRPLRNARVEIREGDAVFDLVGVDDHRGNMGRDDGREDLPKALAGRDAGRAAVLLAHDPSTFRRASTSGIDLQLSGHTHGGQIWPFVYIVRLAVPYVAGHYRKGDAQLYVSRGTGFWGPPMRLFAPSEITEIVIRSPAAGSAGSAGSGGSAVDASRGVGVAA